MEEKLTSFNYSVLCYVVGVGYLDKCKLYQNNYVISMLSKIFLISRFSSMTVFHGSPFLMAAATFNKLKSVGMIDDNSFHFIGIETVAEA